tara:strand:- start:1974 stop:2204 length:231 start_codon:yes stop_codon:yes gene_type:complete
MILKRLSSVIETRQRVDENALLKEFKLHQNGLAPMIEILIRSGHVQKIVNKRGKSLPVQVFYSWHKTKVIPITTLL